jgi:hypothetical protein
MQIGVIVISEPPIVSNHDIARHALFIMESNIRRMQYMINNKYYVSEYSEEAWQEFKTLNV